MEEPTIIRRAQQGESSAFRELVEANKMKIYYLALDLTGNHHDAEDLSQDVFLKAFRNLAAFRGDSEFSSWLYRITVNTFLNKRKKRRERFMSETAQLENLALASGEGTSEHTPDKTARSSQIKEHLNRALSRLSDRERAVFMLRHYHDLPLSEIATTLRVRTGTVKSLLFRGVQKLRRELSFYQQELEV